MTSWGVPSNQLTEEEKAQALFTDGSLCFVGTIREGTAAALPPLSGTPLKDNSERKSFQWSEAQAVQLVVYFAGREKWPS